MRVSTACACALLQQAATARPWSGAAQRRRACCRPSGSLVKAARAGRLCCSRAARARQILPLLCGAVSLASFSPQLLERASGESFLSGVISGAPSASGHGKSALLRHVLGVCRSSVDGVSMAEHTKGAHTRILYAQSSAMLSESTPLYTAKQW